MEYQRKAKEREESGCRDSQSQCPEETRKGYKVGWLGRSGEWCYGEERFFAKSFADLAARLILITTPTIKRTVVEEVPLEA